MKKTKDLILCSREQSCGRIEHQETDVYVVTRLQNWIRVNTKQAMPEATKDIVLESRECQLQTIPKPKPSQSASRNKIVVPKSELNSLLVEENQSGILEVIKKIAIFGGAADDRCRTETIRYCKTLDDSRVELCKQGCTISRLGLYLRLLPRRANTEERKRHVVTVPVKLRKPDSTIHSKHKDDGGPDENPRYERVIVSTIRHFKDLDLDAIYIATNALERSAFNRVELRMAPLSRELTGVLLKYDTFDSHPDFSNRTTDLKLEKRNFESARIVLANIWSQMVIDGFPVVAEYIVPIDTRRNINQTKELKNNATCVEAYLFKRSCGICGVYFVSCKVANQHKQSHKSQQEVVPIAKIRPQRITARRAREVLCLGDDGDAV
ncbi:hypothetical protein EVAR_10166_1 [Eumeta japonica]|uniref:C2H2-type domain-containing protein n=1 Tax=Eumeta variegata TaxID=151549 RepID=A0A4C1TE44_EUMVA|nr:hypothetical protein EVAR_10166_1 [Eumeta japonica]